MQLRFPSLERDVRKAARLELRQDEALWSTYRKHRRNPAQHLPPGFLPHWYFALFIFFTIAQYQDVERHRPHLFFTVVAVYALVTAVYRSLRFRSDLITGEERAVLGHLPVSEQTFLRRKVNRWIAGWISGVLIFSIAYFVGLAGLGLPREQMGANVFRAHLLGPVVFSGLLLAACALCLGMWLLVLTPATLKTSRLKWLYVAPAVCLFLPTPVIQVLWRILLVTPGGWVTQSFAALTGTGATSRHWLIPPAVLCLSLPWAYRRLLPRLQADLDAHPLDRFLDFDEPEDSSENDQFAHTFRG